MKVVLLLLQARMMVQVRVVVVLVMVMVDPCRAGRVLFAAADKARGTNEALRGGRRCVARALAQITEPIAVTWLMLL